MARTKSKAKKRKDKRRRLIRLVYWPLRVFAYALAAAILWVGAYTVIPPLGGYYLATEWVRPRLPRPLSDRVEEARA